MTSKILKGLIVTALVVVGTVILCQGDWHLRRNIHNKLPEGKLTKVQDSHYSDKNELVWRVSPNHKNLFHQPDSLVAKPQKPYPIMDNPPAFDQEYPNLKLQHKLESGASYEAILQVDGTYLVEGSKRGTYNYASPGSFLGNVIHTFVDVIPHLVNSDYKL